MGDVVTEPRHWWQTRTFVLAMALIAIVPLVWPTIPPLVDLPGHMGRYRVQLARFDDPWLGDWYSFQWSLIGNLGVDLLIEPLARILGLELAVKLVVMTIPALIVTGFLWIAREVHGRVPATALFALPFAYSYPFHFGFVNFALSMGLALNAFALWLRLARTGHLGLRALLFVPLSCLLWICHTFGWGVLGVLAFSSEMIRQHDLRKDGRGGHWIESWIRAAVGCAPLALPMVMMVLWRTGDHVTGQTADWFNWHAKYNWLKMVLRDRWQAFDIASAVLIYLILASAVYSVVFSRSRGARIEFSRNLGLSALFLLAVFILLPRIVFGSAYADMRLAPFMVGIAVIGLRPRAALSMRSAAMLAMLGFAFFIVRIAATTVSFWLYDRAYTRALTALDHIPAGGRLVTFVGRRCADDWAYSRLEHIPAIALERKLAYTNDQWSMAGAQLLTTRYFSAGHFAHDPSQIVTDRWCHGEWWHTISWSMAYLPRDAFDYVWLLQPPPYPARLTAGLIPLWRDGNNVLYRIDHGQQGPVVIPGEFMPPPRRR
ncbi:MAG: hypothetical protein ABIS14_05415 [Sphingomonas sp.]